MNYTEFLLQKQHSSNNFGIKPLWIPDSAFDFQAFTADNLIKKGRGAGFLDTGLGKTLIELIIAVNYIRHTNKPVLIICPLAVAFQFIKEAEKFGIDDISYSKDGKYKTKIVICNYERLHLFNPDDYECVICDESSILKNFKGATKNAVTSFVKKIKYRYLFTATPSPNDFVELGTSSEALGYLGYTDMLTKFFTNNEDTISPMNIGTEWILKGHAKENFFKWVSGWSISCRKPSDIGLFDDTKYILPPLTVTDHQIKNDKNMVINGQMLMFNIAARRQTEVREEQKLTIEKRCEFAVDLANRHDTSVYWCNLNAEGDLLAKLDKSAYQISGTMDLDKKEELLLGFFQGNIKKLITKASMTAFGLNWQHCNHTVYFPTWSYEQYYQALRRFYRFGQQREVIVDRVFSDGQSRVLQSIEAKTGKANELFNSLNVNINQNFKVKINPFDKQIKLPSFI